jgi:hypothetical protein
MFGFGAKKCELPSPPEGQHPVADSKSTRALATASTTGGQRWVESNGEGRGMGWALQNHRSQTAKCYFWSGDPNAEVARKCVKIKCAFMPWEKRPDEVRLPETLSTYRTGPKDLRSHTWKQLLEATWHTGNLLACVCVCVRVSIKHWLYGKQADAGTRLFVLKVPECSRDLRAKTDPLQSLFYYRVGS